LADAFKVIAIHRCILGQYHW